MSRIGNRVIIVPEGVTVENNDGIVIIRFPIRLIMTPPYIFILPTIS